MRIISGRYRKKQIIPPSGFSARPTTDIAKEAIFNVLANEFDLETCDILDLFSGTGNISFEFASRECKSVDAVELKFHHFQFIKKTKEELQFNQMQVYKANVFSFVKRSTKNYDIIFADPPYNLYNLSSLPELIFTHTILKKNGWFILEHDENNSFQNHPNFLTMKNYGKVHFSLFDNK